jgi:hypothetical protein
MSELGPIAHWINSVAIALVAGCSIALAILLIALSL